MKRTLACAFFSTLLMTSGCDGDKDSVKPPADTQTPVVTITQPSSGALLGIGAMTMAAQATDDRGVARVEFFVDNAGVGTDASAAADVYECTWNAPPGLHVLRAVAFDAAGNTGSDTVQVFCDAPDDEGPVVAILEPQPDATMDGGTTAIRVTATDESGVARVEFFDNAVKIGEDSVAVGGIYEHEWVARLGRHLLRAVARDVSGNAGVDSAWVTVGVSWQGPQPDPEVFCSDSTGTSIQFAVEEPCRIEVDITIPGTATAVRSLVDGQLSAGWHAVIWDGRDDRGQRLPDGLYTCRMAATCGGLTRLFPASMIGLDCSVGRP